MCVCLGLSEDGAFFLFASSRVFSVPRTSQNIESVFKCNGGLDEKCKYLPGSSLEKMKDLHSDVFSKDNWGLLVAFLNADQLGLTEEEWKLLLHFLLPTLTQIQE